MNKVVITGCLGFVGANLSIFLRKKGISVIGLDNRSKIIGSEANYELITAAGVKYLYCDIRSCEDISGVFKHIGAVDCIFHLASQVSFKRSLESPRNDFEINLLGTFNLLEHVRLHDREARFVYASTNQVYGQLDNIPLKEMVTRYDYLNLEKGVAESFPVDYLSPYGCSKGAGEAYCIDYARVFGLKAVIARLGGIYGEHQYSTEDHGWISYITNMIRLKLPYNRFGHGKQVRDVLHVSDIVRALELLAQKKLEEKAEIFNISGGSENTVSVLELIHLTEKLTNSKSLDTVCEMRKADKLVMYLDTTKAKIELGWSPKVGFVEGIRKLLIWQESLENGINT